MSFTEFLESSETTMDFPFYKNKQSCHLIGTFDDENFDTKYAQLSDEDQFNNSFHFGEEINEFKNENKFLEEPDIKNEMNLNNLNENFNECINLLKKTSIEDFFGNAQPNEIAEHFEIKQEQNSKENKMEIEKISKANDTKENQNKKNSKCGRKKVKDLIKIYLENNDPDVIENFENSKIHTWDTKDNVETKAQKNYFEKSRLTLMALMNLESPNQKHYVAKILPEFTNSIWTKSQDKFNETLEDIFTLHGCAGKQLKLKINKDTNDFNKDVFRKIKENPIFTETKKFLNITFSEFIGLINGKNRNETILKHGLSQKVLTLLPTVEQMVEEEKKKKEGRTQKYCNDGRFEESTVRMLEKYREILLDFENKLGKKKKKEKKNFTKKLSQIIRY